MELSNPVANPLRGAQVAFEFHLPKLFASTICEYPLV